MIRTIVDNKNECIKKPPNRELAQESVAQLHNNATKVAIIFMSCKKIPDNSRECRG